MKKYWNALWHGNGKTKLCLWLMIIMFIAAITCIVLVALGAGIQLGFAAMILFVFDLVFSQTISFSDTKLGGKKGIDPKNPNKMVSYNQESVRKLLKKNHVSKNHKTVMIDRWAEKKILQSPAYMWSEGGQIFFLVLGEREGKYQIPFDAVEKVYYEKNAPVDPDNDYKSLEAGTMNHLVFSSYLPTIFDRNQNGMITTCKNLYVIEPGIRFTNTSAKNVFDVLGVEFTVEDGITRSGKFDEDFIKLYENQILLKDQVLDVIEYRQRVLEILYAMADSDISDQEFVRRLKQMVRYHMVSEEYAVEAMKYARKVREPKENPDHKQDGKKEKNKNKK